MNAKRMLPPAAGAASTRAAPFLLALAWVVAAPTSAMGQDSEGQEGEGQEERRDLRGDELRERIPAVTGQLFLKRGRHEFSTIGNVSIADAFRRKFLGGLAYTFHASDYLSFTGRAGYTFATSHSGAIQICSRPTVCSPPDDDRIDRLPGNINLVAGLQAEFSPLYGKINLVAEKVLHFDVYLTGGLGLTHFTLNKEGEDASGMRPALLMGVGQRYFLNQWIALRLEIFDVMYFQPTSKQDSQLQNEFLFTVGASFFFPTTFTY